MNQILDYNPDGRNRNGGEKGFFKIFAVMLLIFALFLIGGGLFAIFKENDQKKSGKEQTHVEDNTVKAKIDIIQKDTTAVIKVEHDKEIDKIVYKWNSNGTEKIDRGNGNNSYEKEIDAPSGTNKLYVTVKDIDGVETSAEKEITVENGADVEPPKITPLQVDGKIKVVVTDDVAIDFIVYRWTDEEGQTVVEEQKIMASEEDPTKLEYYIDVPRGVNILYVSAVDTSNHTSNFDKRIAGYTKPTIEVNITDDYKKLIITAKHEKGIKEIKYTIYNGDPNDSNTVFKESVITDQNGPEVKFDQDLYIGYNRIKLKVISVENTSEEFDGECVTPVPTTHSPYDVNTATYTNSTNTSNSTTNTTNTTNTNTTANTNTANTTSTNRTTY